MPIGKANPPPAPEPEPQKAEPEVERDPVIVERYRALIALGVSVRDAEELASDLNYVDVVHAIGALIRRGASVTQAVRIIR